MLSRVESSGGDGFPRLPGKNLGIQLLFPQDFERLPLGIVINAGKLNEGRIVWVDRTDYLLNQVESLPYSDDLTCARCGF